MSEANIAARREALRNQGLSPEALLNHIDELERLIATLGDAYKGPSGKVFDNAVKIMAEEEDDSNQAN